jgi:SNF2 family DNA or RNA helicase
VADMSETARQAMRRVWRLGQKQNVTTTSLAYADAIESTLLALMG